MLRKLAFFLAAGCLALVAACSGSSSSPGNETGETPAESTFSKSYGGPANDAATAVVASADGGFLLVGQAGGTSTLNPDGSGGVRGDLWINKLDANGNVEVQRVIGEQATGDLGETFFLLARPTPDGGSILVGQRYFDGDAPLERSDLAVTKLDAQGSVEWARTYDSGPWLNYDYFPTANSTAAASDRGHDIWPLTDGGYVVAGLSTGNLEDRFGIGFPCPLLADEQEDQDPCQDFPPAQPGGRFHEALSVVVLRLDADGSVRWLRRLTEEAFRLDNSQLNMSGSSPNPLVRGTHDGGAIVARTLRNETLFHRLLPDGSPLPLTVIADQLNITDAQQTDDPDDNGRRDGVRNDGFVFSADTVHGDRVIKLAADGSVEWVEQLGGTDVLSPGPFVNLFAVHQRCNTSDACVFATVGTYREDGDRDSSAYLAFLDEDGDSLRDILGPLETTFLRIQGGDNGSPYLLLARNERNEHVFMRLIADGTELGDDGPAPGIAPQVDPSRRDRLPLAELTADGAAVLFDDAEEQRLMRIDARGSVLSDQVLPGSGVAGESAVAAVEIAPGRFVIAGQTVHPTRSSNATGWLLRYDVSGAAENLVWQRGLAVAGIRTRIEALAASGDGGFVGAARQDGDLRLVRFDESGTVLWQTPPLALPQDSSRFRWREVHATTNGYVALAIDTSTTSSVLIGVDQEGSLRLQREYAELLTSLAPNADGSLMLAGPAVDRGAILRVIRTDASGVPQWARIYAPGGGFGLAAGVPLIRRSNDGFVVGMSESGLLTRIGTEGPVSVGAANLFLLKLSDSGSVRWARVYGALFQEELRDLVVRADGVILAAGASDSLGENREGWLLKLGSDGMIAAGCNAHLADIPTQVIGVQDRAIVNRAFDVFNAPGEDAEILVGGPALREATGIVTARQCLGTANPPGEEPPPPAQVRLVVARVGDLNGVVTSTPTGIACGTGLGDQFCAADFAAGTRVVLRADPQNFRRWTTDCEEGTGGSSLECVVTLNANRTVEVQFGQIAGGPAVLTVTPAGTGTGRVTGTGISCPGDCSESFATGTLVALRAIADAGSSFQGWASGCDSIDGDTCILTITASRSVAPVFQLIPTQKSGNP